MAAGEYVGESFSLAAAVGPRFFLGPVPVSDAIITMWVIMALIVGASVLLTRSLNRIPTKRSQSFVETVVEGLLGMVEQQMDGRRARLYIPLLGSLFIFILLSNLSGMLPGAGTAPGFMPPTAVWGVTLGMSLVVALSVQVFGVRTHGLSHFRHFFQPLFLAPLMLILGILEELVRPFSLSVRLFANIFAGETLLHNILAMIPYGLPMLIMGLELILGTIQALIFTLLSTVYIAGATADHH
ncbi:MAG: F0F1 ATP synthase subunit A [Thermaerobacterales bacterium]